MAGRVRACCHYSDELRVGPTRLNPSQRTESGLRDGPAIQISVK